MEHARSERDFGEETEGRRPQKARWPRTVAWLVMGALLAAVGYFKAAEEGRGSLGQGIVIAGMFGAPSSMPVSVDAGAAPPAETAASGAAPQTAPDAGNTEKDAGSAAQSGGVTPEGKVVLNQATEGDLRKLPGVGAARAKAILALREKLGRFRKIDELLRVKGIGRKRLLQWKDKVVLDWPAAK